MNLGKTILELRKAKNATQDDMAAELGVTAAAVSKWENNYTLPDILMLCALADYFQVTTDELLGRNRPSRYVVIAASTLALGKKIEALANRYGFTARKICTSYQDAIETAQADTDITLMLTSMGYPPSEEECRATPSRIQSIESHGGTEQQLLDGFELMLQSVIK